MLNIYCNYKGRHPMFGFSKVSFYNTVGFFRCSSVSPLFNSKYRGHQSQFFMTLNKSMKLYESDSKLKDKFIHPKLTIVIEKMYQHPIPALNINDSWADIAMISYREGWLRKQVKIVKSH